MNNKEYLDIVFKGFSKSHPAYRSRTHQVSRTLSSFAITLLILSFTLYLFVPEPIDSTGKNNSLKVKQKKVVPYSQLSAPPPIDMVDVKPPKRKGISKAPKVAQKKFIKPTVKPDEKITKEELIPSQKELKHVNPGLKDEKGDSLQNVRIQGNENGTDMEIQYDLDEIEIVKDQEATIQEKSPKTEKVFEFVEKQASFPGGREDLYAFIGDRLEYPTIARDNGISGRVIVQFIVEKDGRITNINIARDIGGGCGQEAMRVIQEMPHWIPAEQNGIFVRSRFTLPIHFSLKQ